MPGSLIRGPSGSPGVEQIKFVVPDNVITGENIPLEVEIVKTVAGVETASESVSFTMHIYAEPTRLSVIGGVERRGGKTILRRPPQGSREGSAMWFAAQGLLGPQSDYTVRFTAAAPLSDEARKLGFNSPVTSAVNADTAPTNIDSAPGYQRISFLVPETALTGKVHFIIGGQLIYETSPVAILDALTVTDVHVRNYTSLRQAHRGEEIVVKGTGFNPTLPTTAEANRGAGNYVLFDAAKTFVTIWGEATNADANVSRIAAMARAHWVKSDGTELRVYVPWHGQASTLVTTGTVRVFHQDIAGQFLGATSPQTLTILAKPTFIRASTSGRVGSAIAVTGSNFEGTPNNYRVIFEGAGQDPDDDVSVVAQSVASDGNGLTFVVPSGAKTGRLTLMGGSNLQVTKYVAYNHATNGLTLRGAYSAGYSFSAGDFLLSVPRGASSSLTSFNVPDAPISITKIYVRGDETLRKAHHGEELVIEGTNFSVIAGQNIVLFNDKALDASDSQFGADKMRAHYVNGTGTLLRVLLPTSNGGNLRTGTIRVSFAGSTAISSQSLTLLPVPNFSQLLPSAVRGRVGGTIVVRGSNFGGTPKNYHVLFENTDDDGTDDVSIQPTAVDENGQWISFVVPAGAKTGNVVFSAGHLRYTQVVVVTGPSGEKTQKAYTSGYTLKAGETLERAYYVAAFVSPTAYEVVPAFTLTPLGNSEVRPLQEIEISGTELHHKPTVHTDVVFPDGSTSGVTVRPSGFRGDGTGIFVRVPKSVVAGTIKVVDGGLELSVSPNITVKPYPNPNISAPTVHGAHKGSTMRWVGTSITGEAADYRITFGSSAEVSTANITLASDGTYLDVVVPNDATTGQPKVVIGPDELKRVPYSASSEYSFEIIDAPLALTGLSTGAKNSFFPTAEVVLVGTGFVHGAGNKSLNNKVVLTKAGTDTEVQPWGQATATNLTFRIPETYASGPASVKVRAYFSESSALTLNVLPFPTVNASAGIRAAIGAEISFTGSGFGGTVDDYYVIFPGTSRAKTKPSEVASDGSYLKVVVPSGASGGTLELYAGTTKNIFQATFVPADELTLTLVQPIQARVGQALTITGTGFHPTASSNVLHFGSTTVSAHEIDAQGRLKVRVPAGVQDNVVIKVAESGREATYSGGNFRLLAAPMRARIAIEAASANGYRVGEVVTLQGNHFVGALTDYTLSFATRGARAPVVATAFGNDGNSITFTVPQGAATGDGDLIFSIVDNVIAPVTFSNIPILSALSVTRLDPASARVGQNVALIGSGFSPVLAGNQITFSGVQGAVTPLSTSQNKLTVRVPEGAETGTLRVLSGQASVETPLFTVETTTQPVTDPTFTNFAPSRGRPDDEVVLTGSNFSAALAENMVHFGNTQAVSKSVNNQRTRLTVVVPNLAPGEYSVKLTVGESAPITHSQKFEITAPPLPPAPEPTFTSFSPNSGRPDDEVVLTGSNLSTTSAENVVHFNDTQAVSKSVNSQRTRLTVVVPNLAPGEYSVRLTVGESTPITHSQKFEITASPKPPDGVKPVLLLGKSTQSPLSPPSIQTPSQMCSPYKEGGLAIVF